MTKGVFLFRQGSPYADRPDRRYQFPKRYIKAAREFVGDWIVYNELLDNKKGQGGYRRIAQVTEIIPDPNLDNMYVALIDPASYMEFENFVPYRDGTKFMESRLYTGSNKPAGIVQSAIRSIPDNDFFRICYYGNPLDNFELPRFDADDESLPDQPGMQDDSTPFNFDFENDSFVVSRQRFEQLTSKPIRSKVFRNRVVKAYDKTCAFTGMRFVNGKGRPEVQAAHIRPVEHGGSDRPDNGIALSGTIHWMFDRGMISLSDDYDIMVSRQVNNQDEVWRLMDSSRKARVPNQPEMRPNPHFLGWHRGNCFKH